MRFAHSATVALASLSIAAAILLPAVVGARDDTPDEIASRSNPVTELTPRDVRYYQKQFKTKCARCHGANGNGAGEEAAQQEVPPANLTDASYMDTRSDGQLYYQILMGGGDRCAMPAFGPESMHAWSENKIWYMVAFVRRFSHPPAE